MKIYQSWDDGPVDDLRLIDLLHKYHAKAAFHLSPGLSDKCGRTRSLWPYRGYDVIHLAISEFKGVYEEFEVASHMFHHWGAQAHTLKEFIDDAIAGRCFLEDLFQKSCRGFAWPCGQVTAEAADGLRKEGFLYGRTVEKAKGSVYECADPMRLAPSCHFQDPDFYSIFEKSKEYGGFYFWGHSYEMMNDDSLWNEFERKLAFISETPGMVWENVSEAASFPLMYK